MEIDRWISRWENEGGAVPETKSLSKRGAGKIRRAIRLRRIVVPIDFSPESLKTLRFAKLLASRFSAKLHLVHVVSPPVTSSGRPVSIPPAFSEEGIAARARKRMKELTAELSLQPRSNPSTVRSGAPAKEITEAAQNIDADLIAIATRGHTGLRRAFLGSTTESVVRKTTCPVLVVRDQEDRPPKGSVRHRRTSLRLFRNILVPIDFSECSRLGLEYALGFAGEFDASLVVFHSVFIHAHVLGDEYTAQEVPTLIATEQDYARDEMEKLRRSLASEGRKVKTEIAFGSPVEQINDYLAKEKVDLIITSTHGRTGLRRVFIGSTAERIVRHAPCSVLVVPNRSTTKMSARGK